MTARRWSVKVNWKAWAVANYLAPSGILRCISIGPVRIFGWNK